MFLEILSFLTSFDSGFGVFNYLTIRIAFTLITALFITLFLGKFFINKIKSLQFGQVIRTDGMASHLQKSGTPTMGGLLIVFSFVLSSIFWGDLSNQYLWIVIFTAIIFTALGFIDDYKKIKLQNSDGLSFKKKMIWLTILSSIILFLLLNSDLNFSYQLPFLKDYCDNSKANNC